MTDTPEHEAKCQRCGVSCHAAVEIEGGRQIVLQDLHCVFLGEEDGLPACSVYEGRFKEAPWCLHSSHAARLGALRLGCSYGEPGVGKERVTEEEFRLLWPKIVEGLLAIPSMNPHFTWKKFFSQMRKVDPDFRWYLERNVTGAVRLRRKATAWARLREKLLP
ncbi:hypothetical protein CMI37_19075 [Candidatus Pacearchaeota archaeon]|nr:hypothetical protein [Candidatus Pacearchaeota archaeon]